MEVDQEFNKRFREVGVAEFFRKNLQMLGYSGAIRSFTTIVHEFVTNALDACEEYGILPRIKVRVKDVGKVETRRLERMLERRQKKLKKLNKSDKKDESKITKLRVEISELERDIEEASGHYIVTVEDNGPGIPPEYVPKVYGNMLSGTKFHRYIQSRGQQGIGAVGAVLFSQMTTGQPTKIVTSTGNGKIAVVFLRVDVEKNRAKIVEESIVEGDWQGTKIVCEFKDLLYRRGSQSPYEYLRRTAIANPHATIIFQEPDGTKTKWKRTAKEIPPLPKEMQPHPLGVSADDLMRMSKKTNSRKVSTFMQSELSRVSSMRADEIMKKSGIEDKDPAEMTHTDAERLVSAFKRVDLMSPPTDGLTPIEEDYLEKSLEDVLSSKFIATSTRSPDVYRGGIPFQAEVAIAYGGKAGRKTSEGRGVEIMRFANKSPLLFDTGACAITQAIKSVNWNRYNVSDYEKSPLTVLVNVLSPHIPYQSAGKQAIAEDEDVVKEIRYAVMEVARKLKRYLAGIHRRRLKVKRRNVFLKYAPEVAGALSKLSSKKKEPIENMLIGIIEKRVDLGDKD